MITQETAGRIWNCYHEIEVGLKLLNEMTDALERGDDPNPRDSFGRRRQLTLGVPSGENCHRLLDVAPRLAVSVINAHVAEKRRELAEANELARIELGNP
jgi:hypothetical protein